MKKLATFKRCLCRFVVLPPLALILHAAGMCICLAGQGQPELQISSPASNTVINPGQALPITVTSPANLTFTSVGVVGETPFGFADLAASVPAQFTYNVPTLIACRTYMFNASGMAASGQTYDAAPLVIDIERPDMPLSLTTQSSNLPFQDQGETYPLRLLATFSDGSTLDVTDSTHVSYTSSNTGIATVDQFGVVTSVATGKAYITATYTLGSNKVQLIVPATMGNPSGVGTATSGTFSLSASPGQQTVIPGNSAAFQVNASSFDGFAGSLNLSVNGLPTGATANFVPSTLNIGSSSTLTITTSSSTPTGAYIVTVTGANGSATSTASAQVIVGSLSSSYSYLTVQPTSQLLLAGSSTTATVSLQCSGTCQDTTTLSASGLPNNVTASFNPSAINGVGSSTLTLTASGTASPGNYTVTISGTGSAALAANTTVTVWAHKDVGAVGVAGSASYANGTFTVSAAGPRIFSTSDGMHFVYYPLSGDGTIIARVVSMSGMRSGTSARAGVMIREALSASSDHAYSAYCSFDSGTGGPISEFLWRPSNGGSTSFVNSAGISSPYWVKLVRSGNVFNSFISPNGSSWTQVGSSQTIPMATNVYAGLAVSSNDGNNNSLVTATIDNVSITSTAWIKPGAPWNDQDVGAVGLAGTASYTNGVYTVSGAGPSIFGTADGMHFAYQSLTGDGTIVARVLNVQGMRSGTSGRAGVMIRSTLSSNSPQADSTYCTFDSGTGGPIAEFLWRSATGGSTSYVNSGQILLPYWVKMVRSGSVFSAYISGDGVTWRQVGSNQTISMASGVYIGLAVSSNDSTNNTLITATFDNVSVSSSSAPAPLISSLSTTVGLPGNALTISGTGFGATQGGGEVRLNGSAMQIDSWSNTSIGVTVPSGATSGPMAVAVAPSMNSSNAAIFKVLPYPMQDQDVGAVGQAGIASYANGVFTITAAGPQVYGTADGMHFVYQPLSGNGTVIARVLSLSGARVGTSARVGVMIRESLNPNSTHGYSAYTNYDSIIKTPIGIFLRRLTTGGNTTFDNSASISAPYWVKLVRSGNTFSAFISPNGTSWTQVGANQTISMATNVYVGIAVSSNDSNNNTLVTATVDNFSVQ